MKQKILAEIERLKNKDFSGTYDARYALDLVATFINSLPEEPVSEDLIQASEEYIIPWQVYAEDADGELLLTNEPCERAFIAGAQWQFERVKEALLSEVLPCFMHGGEADEVIAKLEEVLMKNEGLV